MDDALTPQEFAALQTLTPAQAVAYLQARGKLSRSFNWQDVWQEEHAQQFTVSRLARLDLLQAIYDAILQSVNGDLTRTDWTRQIEELLMRSGWWGSNEVIDPQTGETVITRFNSARLRLIFDMNTRMAYSAGVWDRVQAAKRTHPYVRYVTKRDDRVRDEHAAWDNLALPADHDFWKTHWPPNGWRCRCRVVPLSRSAYRQGYTQERPNAEDDVNAASIQRPLKTQAPAVEMREYVNKRTGEVSQVPQGVDPGFAYNPGQARQQAMQQLTQDKLAAANPALAQAARNAGLEDDTQ